MQRFGVKRPQSSDLADELDFLSTPPVPFPVTPPGMPGTQQPFSTEPEAGPPPTKVPRIETFLKRPSAQLQQQSDSVFSSKAGQDGMGQCTLTTSVQTKTAAQHVQDMTLCSFPAYLQQNRSFTTLHNDGCSSPCSLTPRTLTGSDGDIPSSRSGTFVSPSPVPCPRSCSSGRTPPERGTFTAGDTSSDETDSHSDGVWNDHHFTPGTSSKNYWPSVGNTEGHSTSTGKGDSSEVDHSHNSTSRGSATPAFSASLDQKATNTASLETPARSSASQTPLDVSKMSARAEPGLIASATFRRDGTATPLHEVNNVTATAASVSTTNISFPKANSRSIGRTTTFLVPQAKLLLVPVSRSSVRNPLIQGARTDPAPDGFVSAVKAAIESSKASGSQVQLKTPTVAAVHTRTLLRLQPITSSGVATERESPTSTPQLGLIYSAAPAGSGRPTCQQLKWLVPDTSVKALKVVLPQSTVSVAASVGERTVTTSAPKTQTVTAASKRGVTTSQQQACLKKAAIAFVQQAEMSTAVSEKVVTTSAPQVGANTAGAAESVVTISTSQGQTLTAANDTAASTPVSHSLLDIKAAIETITATSFSQQSKANIIAALATIGTTSVQQNEARFIPASSDNPEEETTSPGAKAADRSPDVGISKAESLTTDKNREKCKLLKQDFFTKRLIPDYLDHLIGENALTVGQLHGGVTRHKHQSLGPEVTATVNAVISNASSLTNNSSAKSYTATAASEAKPGRSALMPGNESSLSGWSLSVYDLQYPRTPGSCQSFAQMLQSYWAFPTARFMAWVHTRNQHSLDSSKFQSIQLDAMSCVPRTFFQDARDLDNYIFFQCQKKKEALEIKKGSQAAKD